MGHTLARLSCDAGCRWTIEARRRDGSLVSLAADTVISSAPIRELCRALDPAPDCAAAAEQLRYRDFLTVALVLNQPDPFPDNWVYIHEPSVKVGRIQNFRSWSPEMMPDASSSCLGLEYFCFEGDGLWSKSDGELIALATAELAEIGLARPEEIADGCVVRQRKAYPVYDEGYRQRVDVIRDELAWRYPSLHLVGRNGMHKYNNQDHAMMTAMLACRNILAGERVYDVWSVNEDAEYHEAGVSGAAQALDSVRLVPAKRDGMITRGWAVAADARIGRLVRAASGIGAQSCRYFVTSLLALACDLLVYTGLLRIGLIAAAAGAIGYLAGLCLHYRLSASWVFPDPARRRRALPTFAKFAATGLLGVATTAAIIGILTGTGVAGAFYAKAVAVGSTYVAVFLLRRILVFADPSARAIAAQSSR